MPPASPTSLWSALSGGGDLSAPSLCDRGLRVAFGEAVCSSVLGGRGDELRGRSVLLATLDQLTAALVLIELDGIVRRIVLCAPDLPPDHLSFVLAAASVDAIVSDRSIEGLDVSGVSYFIADTGRIAPQTYDRGTQCRTEWILLTSGTTGLPKLVVHTLESLAGAIRQGSVPGNEIIWSTFYDSRRYGGLQIFLRAALTGTTLVLSNSRESTADFLVRAGADGVTHISGTPSHWRRALMSPLARSISPRYVRLSGEIADQAILNSLRSFYPQAAISHAFASTEAGVAFDVTDGLAGFPASLLENTPGVEMKVVDNSLRIRSSRTAAGYLGTGTGSLKDGNGFVDTGDIVELRGDRYHFVGRRDGIINVGGLKVCPEEVEAVINRHPDVRMSLVRMKKNPITGALVIADVVLNAGVSPSGTEIPEIRLKILRFCREALPAHKVPSAINIVPVLAVAGTGKLVRHHA